MDIDKLREMSWKEKRNLAETTDSSQVLILLADDKSALVRNEVLYRVEAPIQAFENLYKHASTQKQKGKILKRLTNDFKPDESLKSLLSKMCNDSDLDIGIVAIRMYRRLFPTLKPDSNHFLDPETVDSKYILNDWAIQLPGFGEETELAQNPNLTNELAHKFVLALLDFETRAYHVQKCLYYVLSHKEIEQRTIQYVFDYYFGPWRIPSFHIKPKYAIAACQCATPEMLDAIMDEYQRDTDLYLDENSSLYSLGEHFAKFYSALITNPNCSKETFEKAFNLFIKHFQIDWPSTLRDLCKSPFFTKEHLLYVLEHHCDKVFMFLYAPKMLAEIEPEILTGIVSNFTPSQKSWILEYARQIPEYLKDILKSRSLS